MNELLSRQDKYDAVFITTRLNYSTKFIERFLTPTGLVVHAVESNMPSDEYGIFMRMMFKVSTYIHSE